MKQIHIKLLLSILILGACNNEVSENKKGVEIEKVDSLIENNITNVVVNEAHANLFNLELVGLTKSHENDDQFYVDFSSACMCNSPSILLKDKKAYLFGYCKDTLPPHSKDPYYTYDIIDKVETEKGLTVLLKSDIDESLKLIFTESDHEYIYELDVNGVFPTDYIGNNICSFFTFKAEKFEVIDCGDFDG